MNISSVLLASIPVLSQSNMWMTGWKQSDEEDSPPKPHHAQQCHAWHLWGLGFALVSVLWGSVGGRLPRCCCKKLTLCLFWKTFTQRKQVIQILSCWRQQPEEAALLLEKLLNVPPRRPSIGQFPPQVGTVWSWFYHVSHVSWMSSW